MEAQLRGYSLEQLQAMQQEAVQGRLQQQLTSSYALMAYKSELRLGAGPCILHLLCSMQAH